MSGLTPRPRGLAAMTPERRKQIAAMGGASVPADKRSFSTDRDLSVSAGSKGGKISRKKPVDGAA